LLAAQPGRDGEVALTRYRGVVALCLILVGAMSIGYVHGEMLVRMLPGVAN
jgi:hypothetical protein